jgi:hypothetical protein
MARLSNQAVGLDNQLQNDAPVNCHHADRFSGRKALLSTSSTSRLG